MNAIKRVIGVVLLLAGLWYVFTAVVVAIGERHLFHGWNILAFAIVTIVGLGVAGVGMFLAFVGRSGGKVF